MIVRRSTTFHHQNSSGAQAPRDRSQVHHITDEDGSAGGGGSRIDESYVAQPINLQSTNLEAASDPDEETELPSQAEPRERRRFDPAQCPTLPESRDADGSVRAAAQVHISAARPHSLASTARDTGAIKPANSSVVLLLPSDLEVDRADIHAECASCIDARRSTATTTVILAAFALSRAK